MSYPNFKYLVKVFQPGNDCAVDHFDQVFPNPVSKGDTVCFGDEALEVDRVVHHNERGATWSEIHLTEHN
jgi:hypothetical protein